LVKGIDCLFLDVSQPMNRKWSWCSVCVCVCVYASLPVMGLCVYITGANMHLILFCLESHKLMEWHHHLSHCYWSPINWWVASSSPLTKYQTLDGRRKK
jgi:hypothetical protein